MEYSNDIRYAEWVKSVVGDIRWESIPCCPALKHMVGIVRRTEDDEPLIQRCDLVAPMMASVFPELKVVSGEYSGPSTCGEGIYHCWLVDSCGSIVDPTGRQFDLFDCPDSYKKGKYYAMG